MLPNSHYWYSLQGQYHPDTKTRWRYHLKKKLQDNVTDEYACKYSLKILANIKYISCVKLEFYLVNLFKGEWLLIANFNKFLSLFQIPEIKIYTFN